MIRAVLFDLGNVLVFHDNALLMRRMAERAGTTTQALEARFAPDLWDRMNRGLLDEAGIYRELNRGLGLSLSDDEMLALFCCHFTLHDAVLPLVESLVGKVKLVLLSNTNAVHARWFLPRVPLLEKFDSLVLSHEVGMAKPDRAIYEEALRRAGASADETAYFDDWEAYVKAGAELGIHARQFTTAAKFREQLAELHLARGPKRPRVPSRAD